jgi:hypothetical protein
MANKICERCKKDLPKADFEKTRLNCRACTSMERNISKSSSPHKYLKNLWSHLKYSREKTEGMVFEITPEDLSELWNKSKRPLFVVRGLYDVAQGWRKTEHERVD